MRVLVRPVEVGRAVIAARLAMTFFVMPWWRWWSIWRLLRWGWRTLRRRAWRLGRTGTISVGGQLNLDALSLARYRLCIDVVLDVTSLFCKILGLA